jgi:hypothetical protein
VQSFPAHLRPSCISREGIRAQAAMTSVIECGAVRPPCNASTQCGAADDRMPHSIDHTCNARIQSQTNKAYSARGTTNIVLPVRSQELWAKVVRDEVENVVPARPRKGRRQTSGGCSLPLHATCCMCCQISKSLEFSNNNCNITITTIIIIITHV